MFYKRYFLVFQEAYIFWTKEYLNFLKNVLRIEERWIGL
jgi:hypothetical protein